ncbi:hypothetical protein [Phreatobacter sp.]|uniref:hypothetical protein n=1 Tax=Phreatobacter sp. TaxID=1966341 RepID=UPI003F71D911
MLRIAVIVVVAYAAGHPALASARPEVLDKALSGFHGDVNSVSDSVWRSMVAADRTGLLRALGNATGLGTAR